MPCPIEQKRYPEIIQPLPVERMPAGLRAFMLARYGIGGLNNSYMPTPDLRGAVYRATNFTPDQDATITCDLEGDTYLNMLAACAIGEQERAVTLRLIPGLREYYERMGLLQPGQLIEVDATISYDQTDNPQVKPFPNGDVITQLANAGVKFDQSVLFSLTFATEQTREALKAMNAEVMQQTDHNIATKAHLHEHAAQYGIPMCKGMVVHTPADIGTLLEKFGNVEKGVWRKLVKSSGGDGTDKITQMTVETVTQSIQKAVDLLQTALEINDYSALSLNDLVNDEGIPHEGLVFEIDAANYIPEGTSGNVLICSNMIVIGEEKVQVLNDYVQDTRDGVYYGSRPLTLTPAEKQMVDQHMGAIGRYGINELQHQGIAGIDYALIYQDVEVDGEIQKKLIDVRILEVNWRDPISGNAQQVMDHIRLLHDRIDMQQQSEYGMGTFLNVNFELPEDIRTFEDIEKWIGRDLLYGSISKGMVIPIACRTITSGDEQIVSSKFKGLIIGEDEEQVNRIKIELQSRGIRC